MISPGSYLFLIVGVSSTDALSEPSPLSVMTTVTSASLFVIVQPFSLVYSPTVSVIVYLYVPALVYTISPNGISLAPVSAAS